MAESGWQRCLEAGTQENAQLIYVCYLLSVAIGITALIGVVMAHLNRSEGEGWVRDHYTFLIRTFWIGLLYGVVGLALSIFLIGIPILIATSVWWIVRCVQGLGYASKQQPIPSPESWLFAG
jgi:uncharacterized membrane protein